MPFWMESSFMGSDDVDEIDYGHLDELIEDKFSDEKVSDGVDVTDAEWEEVEVEVVDPDDDDEDPITWPSSDDDPVKVPWDTGDLHMALSNAGHPAYDYGTVVRDDAFYVFDARTAQALRRFQRANGLEVTGEVDDATEQALGL